MSFAILGLAAHPAQWRRDGVADCANAGDRFEQIRALAGGSLEVGKFSFRPDELVVFLDRIVLDVPAEFALGRGIARSPVGEDFAARLVRIPKWIMLEQEVVRKNLSPR